MNTEKENMNSDAAYPNEQLTEAAWLNEVLQIARVARAYAPETNEAIPARARARIARKIHATALKQLRAERERFGFLPLAFGAYLQELARQVALDLQPILAAFGIIEVERPTSQSATAFAWLARELGFDLTQLSLHVRLSVAACQGIAEPILAAHHAGYAGDDRALCEAAFEHLEAAYDRQTFAELQRIQAALRAVYDEADRSV